MRVFRIYMSDNKDDYLDYEAKNYQDAFEQFRKETHRAWCWTVHLLKGRELKKWQRERGICS